MIELIEWKIRMNQPYAGVFLRKNPENDSDIVTDLNDVHQVGAFVKISELERFDDKLQLIATGYRRIKINKIHDCKQFLDLFTKVKSKKSTEEPQAVAKEKKQKPSESDDSKKILMVETENFTSPRVDTNSTEYKALTLEIITSIRDIISINSLIRDSLQQILGQNLKVTDNFDYLADLAAAITSATPSELQEIIEEQDVKRKKI